MFMKLFRRIFPKKEQFIIGQTYVHIRDVTNPKNVIMINHVDKETQYDVMKKHMGRSSIESYRKKIYWVTFFHMEDTNKILFEDWLNIDNYRPIFFDNFFDTKKVLILLKNK